MGTLATRAIALFNNGRVAATTLAVTVAAPSAFAGGSQYDPITSAVDWAEVITGVLAISGLIAAVYVVVAGAKMLLRTVKRA